MSEEKDSKPFGRNTCHVCGGTEFTWGQFRTPTYMRIVPEVVGFLGRLLGGRSFPRLRICDTCGNVQMFLKQEEK